VDSDLIAALGFVKASKYRQKIILMLSDNILIPSEIAKSIGIQMSHVSKILSQLRQKELVDCINEAGKKGRLYTLTDKGKVIRNLLK